jgi:hypothetical protein
MSRRLIPAFMFENAKVARTAAKFLTHECPWHSFDRERATKEGRDAAASLPSLNLMRLTAIGHARALIKKW